MDINSNYEVVISDSAKEDLEEIYFNISEKKQEKLMNQIEENVLRLEQFPYSCTETRVKPHNELFRKLIIEDYIVLYEVDENYKQVTIYNVVYGNSDYLM